MLQIYGPSYFRAGAEDMQGQGYADYLAEDANHRANARARLTMLDAYVRPGRLLDVGAAAGFFVAEARMRGWDAWGVELAPEMAAFGRDQLQLDVRTCSFADARVEPQSLDAITMWDYIEHSVDPAADLRRAADAVRSGGVLALSTGDAASLVARLSGSRWHLLTPRHHNFFFTAGVLERALRDVGFEVVEEAHRSSLYSVLYLAHKLRTLVDVSVVRRIADGARRQGFGQRTIPVNLFDIITVVARRLPCAE